MAKSFAGSGGMGAMVALCAAMNAGTRAGLGAELHLVVPAAFENVEGGVNNGIPIGGGSAGAYQVVYAADQLLPIPVKSKITAFQVRQDNNIGFLAWPNTALTIANYRVIMARGAIAPPGVSSTFAANLIEPQLVRAGPLVLAAKTYPGGFPIGGTTPKAWGPEIALDVAYEYEGGPLAIEFRNGGVVSSISSADAHFNDARAAGGGNATSPDATTSNGGSALIIRLTYIVAGCPADLNNDAQVDDADFVIFLFAYNILDCADASMPAGCPADLTSDAFVDDGDFVVFLAAYNELVCP